jgi:hypothetical protein
MTHRVLRGGRALGLLVAASALILSCHKKSDAPAPAGMDIGKQTANIAADTKALREASAAVNALYRHATAEDCPAVREALPEVNGKLVEAAGLVRTQTGRETLAALRTQIDRAEQLCPAP